MNQGLKYFSNITRYVETYTDPEVLAENFKIIKKFLSKINKKEINSICDVGCGAGENLEFLEDYFKKNKLECYGIEPSLNAVKLLKKKYTKFNLFFKKNSIHNIDFPNEKFDLVFCWSVLHWIDRDLYLQSLGEMIRVSNKYLLIMDFGPKIDHKNIYKHKKGINTYKTDFDVILNNSGILEKLYQTYFYFDEKTMKIVCLPNLNKISKSDKKNYHIRRVCLYKKNSNVLPKIRF